MTGITNIANHTNDSMTSRLSRTAGDPIKVLSNVATDLATLTYSAADRVAIMLGAEGRGLSERALASATRRIQIPMSGNSDSLNVGSAAAVTFYALRQARRS